LTVNTFLEEFNSAVTLARSKVAHLRCEINIHTDHMHVNLRVSNPVGEELGISTVQKLYSGALRA